MKKIFFLALLILVSCAPQATVVSTATATLPSPTATVIPAPTIFPEFISIQSQIAGDTEDYTIMGNGQIEGKQPDGTLGVIPGIKLNADGKSYTIMVDGKPINLAVSEVTITDEGVRVKGYQNADFDENYEIVTTYSMNQLAEMTREQSRDLAPAISPEGFVRGEVSTLEGKENLVKYYDKNGKLYTTFDLTSGEFLSLAEAGIVELVRTDGDYYEMEGFRFMEDVSKLEPWQIKNLQYDLIYRAVDHMLKSGVDWGNPASENVNKLSVGNIEFFESIWKIAGIKPIGGAMIPLDKQDIPNETFFVMHASLDQPGYRGSLMWYINGKDHVRRILYIDMSVEDAKSLLYSMSIEKREE